MTTITRAMLVAMLLLSCSLAFAQTDDAPTQQGNVIFLHPDGTSAANWVAVRNLTVGPDGDLNWDKLPAMALYRGHMLSALTATSNGGVTTARARSPSSPRPTASAAACPSPSSGRPAATSPAASSSAAKASTAT